MDAAFKQSGHNFAVALDHIKGHKKEERVVETIIDGKMQPFGGLVKISQQNEEAANSVKRLFQDLFEDDADDLKKREEKIATFFQGSEELRLKYFPNYYSYKQTAICFFIARRNIICTKQMRQSFLRIAWSTMAIGALATKLN